MSIERGPVVNLHEGGQEAKPTTPEALVEHFQDMGLQTRRLVLDWIKFAEFEMFGTDATVKIEVKRPDGNLTRCFLSRGESKVDGHKYVYLQIATKITDEDCNYGTEAHGIFPVPITEVQSCSAHGRVHQNFKSLDFVTSNGGTVGIREDGTIDFSQGKF